MHTRTLGASGPAVGAIGLGCMGMSGVYSGGPLDDDSSIDTILAAVDLGVTLIDTAHVYGNGHNELLVGRATKGIRDRVTIASKGGLIEADPAKHEMTFDGSRATLHAQIDESLRRLGTDYIDIFYLHRIAPTTPVEESWAALADAVAAGKVRHLGLCEVTVDEATRAHAVHPVAAIQSEFSLWARDPQTNGILEWTRENGAGFIPFGPLGQGFLTGSITTETTFASTDFRSHSPRFTTDSIAQAQGIVDTVITIAGEYDATPGQIALAWVLAQGEHVVPIPRHTHTTAPCRKSRLSRNLALAGAPRHARRGDTLARLAALVGRSKKAAHPSSDAQPRAC